LDGTRKGATPAIRSPHCSAGFVRVAFTATCFGVTLPAARRTLNRLAIEITCGVTTSAKRLIAENEPDGHPQQAEPDNNNGEYSIGEY